MRVTVDPHDGVEVVLPARAPAREAAAAVAELRGWIERRLAEAEAVRAQVAARAGDRALPGPRPDARARGRAHPRAPPRRRAAGARRACDGRPPPWSAGTGGPPATEIAPRLDAAVARLGRSYTRLAIRAQRTRWGSCSSTGVLSFNWRLLLAPEVVLDYVVWHEACHLVVMDHSPRFWALVAEHCPGYQQPRRWLRAHGATLVL